MKVVTYPVGPLFDDAPVAFTPEAWAELLQETAGRGAAADRLLDAGQSAIARAESSSGAYQRVADASLLEAQGLVKSYKGRRVVNDVSVRLEQGEIVGLLGPNGAGKTTTFYMITGLIRPDRGRITLNGRDVTAEPMYQRARAGIGYLAQEPSVFRKLTVEENIRAILETLPLDDATQAERPRPPLRQPALRALPPPKGCAPSGGARGAPHGARVGSGPTPAGGPGGRPAAGGRVGRATTPPA